MTHSMKSRSTQTSEYNRTDSACSTQIPYSLHTQNEAISFSSLLGISAITSLLGIIVLPRTIILL